MADDVPVTTIVLPEPEGGDVKLRFYDEPV